MVWSFVMNVLLGIIALITMLFCIGTLDQALATEVPYLQLFLNSGSHGLAYFLIVLLFILIFSGNITALATTSREVFAFARDTGFPFSRWLSKIEHKRHVPFNAVYATAFFSGVLCLINLGSTFAFNIIISLTLLALLSTYMLSIGCLLLKRIRNERLPPARWSLGRLGLPINAFAFAYSGFAIVMSCFPGGPSCHIRQRKLGASGVGWGHLPFHFELLPARQATFHRTSRVRRGKKNGWSAGFRIDTRLGASLRATNVNVKWQG